MVFHSMIVGYLGLASLHGAVFDVDPLADAAVERLYDVICLISEDLHGWLACSEPTGTASRLSRTPARHVGEAYRCVTLRTASAMPCRLG